MLRKTGKILAALIAVVLIGLIALYVGTNPEPPPSSSASSEWLQSGPYSVGQTDIVFVDDSRPTSENNGAAGATDRTLVTTLWYPRNVEGNHTLIIHSHGFGSNRRDLTYVVEQLASYGYVVAAANYPRTAGFTPGGPNANDVVNQPGDISFLIDSIIALSGPDKPFFGNIDSDRIGLTGFSLGGLTTSLATYDQRWRDDRIAAAVSIAGLSGVLRAKFYESVRVPFLVIAGTADALVDHQSNAATIPDRIGNGELLSIAGGSHMGFADPAEPLMRLSFNPDGLGCDLLENAGLIGPDVDEHAILRSLGTAEQGFFLDPDEPSVCEPVVLRQAVHPGRQQMITRIGVLSFFESVFAVSERERQSARNQLIYGIAEDFPEASYAR